MVAGVAGSKREKGSGVCRHVEANEDRWGWNEVIQLLSHVVVDLETFFSSYDLLQMEIVGG
jgi:hypothetical protein